LHFGLHASAASLRLHFQVHRAIDPTSEKAVSTGSITRLADADVSCTPSAAVGASTVWVNQSGRLVRRLQQGGGHGFCQFSPDGKWLATGLDGNRVWAVKVEPWREGHRLQQGDGLYPVFSPDSTFIAHETHRGTVGLVDVASGHEIAQLPDPSLDLASPLFTPDGTRLITLTNGSVPGIHVWDLSSIRRELAALGLDWQ
jgi:WD40 repeat protein